jgi:hypothetical protein
MAKSVGQQRKQYEKILEKYIEYIKIYVKLLRRKITEQKIENGPCFASTVWEGGRGREEGCKLFCELIPEEKVRTSRITGSSADLRKGLTAVNF